MVQKVQVINRIWIVNCRKTRLTKITLFVLLEASNKTEHKFEKPCTDIVKQDY